jgi:hypothetical protein
MRGLRSKTKSRRVDTRDHFVIWRDHYEAAEGAVCEALAEVGHEYGWLTRAGRIIDPDSTPESRQAEAVADFNHEIRRQAGKLPADGSSVDMNRAIRKAGGR